MSLLDSEIKDGLLTVRQARPGGYTLIALAGELDLSNVNALEEPLLDAIASGEDVVVDLGQLEFIDSTGISLLVTAVRKKESGLSFLPCESAEVRRVLSLTGLDQRMKLAIVEPPVAVERPPVLPAA